ncbi:MAG TPA: glycosyltransferase family 9 protein [Xanthobacteraceae bacterium]|jgi:ADP-heptose:LPS heptosyltransferase|nr:glycosyltransferase family 9 protein [Xanthobacteraceae bacterium]
MKIDTMRRIDRLAGVPLCAIATGLVWLRDWLSRRGARPIKRILFVELSEMGTTVLAEPAMRKARAAGAELFFVIFTRNVGSLELLGTFPRENIFTISDRSVFALAADTLRFLMWTRRKGIDTVVDMELFSRFTALLSGLSSADRRVGFHRFHQEGLFRGEMLTHRVGYNPHIHIAKNLIALIDALYAPAPQVPFTKTVIGDDQITASIAPASAATRERVLTRIQSLVPFDPARQRLILINPNASELLPHRRWMPDRFAQLIRRVVSAHDDAVVLITGAPDERAEAERLAAASGPRCVSFAGHSALAELPALYAHACLMVTNDSGPAHFAAASGLSTIVLFGPETPKLYQPLGSSRAIYAGLACSPCVSAHNHRKTACTDNVCMQAISVDDVYVAVAEELAASAPASVPQLQNATP